MLLCGSVPERSSVAALILHILAVWKNSWLETCAFVTQPLSRRFWHFVVVIQTNYKTKHLKNMHLKKRHWIILLFPDLMNQHRIQKNLVYVFVCVNVESFTCINKCKYNHKFIWLRINTAPPCHGVTVSRCHGVTHEKLGSTPKWDGMWLQCRWSCLTWRNLVGPKNDIPEHESKQCLLQQRWAMARSRPSPPLLQILIALTILAAVPDAMRTGIPHCELHANGCHRTGFVHSCGLTCLSNVK